MRWSGYRDYLIGVGLSDKTITRYVRWVRDADEWLQAQGLALDTASATQVREWSEQRVRDSHSCRGQASAALGHYWRSLQRSDAPFKAIRIPGAPEYESRAIEEEQARDVVKMAIGWWPEGTVVLAGLYLALRRFEIAKMEWSRFSNDGQWYRVTGKYDKTKDLPVHPILWSELESRAGEGRWVFPGRYPGRHIHEATVWDWTQRVGRAAGIPHLEPHELRHTALTTANDTLGDLRAVQRFARHSDPATTAIYTRVRKDKLRQVSAALDYLK
jgi:integrase